MLYFPVMRWMLLELVVILVSQIYAEDPLDHHLDGSTDVEEAAKLVEEYVVAADFDNRPVAQLINPSGSLQHNTTTWIEESSTTVEPTKGVISAVSRIIDEHKGDSSMTAAYFHQPPQVDAEFHNSPSHFSPYFDGAGHFGPDPIDRDVLAAPAAAPIAVSQRSILAVGFITFIILLSSIQSSMMSAMLMTRRPAGNAGGSSLLGGVTQALGRRRRRSLSYLQE